MSKLRDILAIIIFCSFFFNCSSTTEGEGSEEEYHGIGAYAGPDQICKIGHVVVLDGSKSNAPEGEVISGYSWTQSGKNPEEVDLLKRQEIQYTTFKQVGEYKFYLRIEAGDQYSAIDSVIVTVQPSGSDIFIDPHMEATVRFALNHYTKKLTNEHLLSLDSILAPWFVEITNLGGLERCGNLEYLLLDRHSIEDLTPIKNLTKLLFLRVDQNFAITDVSPLAGLTNLEYLDISDNLVTDISPLFRLTNLTYFGAQFNQGISDISVVSNFQNIEKLYLSKSPIHNISPVANLTKLQKLWLAKCDISDITPVQNLVKLRLIYFKCNNISYISPIRNIVNF